MGAIFVRASRRAKAYVRGGQVARKIGLYNKSGSFNTRAKKIGQRGRANAKSLTELGLISHRENLRIITRTNTTVKGRRAAMRTYLATKQQRKAIRF